MDDRNSSRDEGSTDPPRKRRRPALSCVECRKRKIKCDRNRPCGPCVQARSPSCTFTEDAARLPTVVHTLHEPVAKPALQTTAPAIVASPTQSSTRLGPERQYTTSEPSPASISATASTTKSRTSPWTNGSDRIPNGDPALEKSRITIHGLDKRPPGFKETHTNCDKDRIEYADNAPQQISKTRFVGPSHWACYAGEFRAIRTFTRATMTDPVLNAQREEVKQMLIKCKEVGKACKLQEQCIDISDSELKATVPPRIVADRLVQLYLETFEPLYRMFHVPSFMKDYQSFWQDFDNTSSHFYHILLLVMAIGQVFYDNSDNAGDSQLRDLRACARQWIFSTYRKYSGPPEKRCLDMKVVQVYCLLHLARGIVAVEGDILNIQTGTMLGLALQIGLHRDPLQTPKTRMHTTSALRDELWRRLWWTVVEIAVDSALELGLPPMISFGDFNTELPANIDDDELDEVMKEVPHSRPMDSLTQSSIQLLLQKSLETRFKIVKLANGCGVKSSYEKVIELGAELTRICQMTSDLIQKYNTSEGSPQTSSPSSFHQTYIDYIFRRSLIALHSPFALKSRADPRFYYSRKICVDCALSITSFIEDDRFSRLMLWSGGPYRGLVVHGVSILCLDILHELEEEKQLPILHHSNALRQPLRAAADRLLQVAEDRIRKAENNFKFGGFLSMSMATIEALENGRPAESSIMEAAKRNAQFYLEAVKSRLGAPTVSLTPLYNENSILEIQAAENLQRAANGQPAIPMSAEIGNDFTFAGIPEGIFDFDITQQWFFNNLGDF